VEALPEVNFEIVTNRLPGTPAVESLGSNCRVLRFTPTDYSSTRLGKKPWKVAWFSAEVAQEWIRFLRKRKFVERGEFDLFHFNGPLTNYGFFSFDRLLGRPVLTKALDFSAFPIAKVMTLHGLPSLLTSSQIDRENEKRHVLSFDRIVIVDRYMADAISQLVGDSSHIPPIHFIPNGVDTARFAYHPPPPSPPIRIGFLGRLDEAKGASLLLQIARHLPEGMELWLAIPGKAPGLEQFPRKPQLRIFRNLPYREVPFFLASVHVLLNPLKIQGISRATLEAMSVGRPVIMPPGGDRHPVVHEDTGFLCPASGTAILAMLRSLAENIDTLEAVGRRAREVIVRDFDSHALARRLLDVFGKAIRQGG